MVASVNTNFIVQNGLTVGPTTIFAGNGDVLTTGNISVTGGGSFGGLSSNQIYSGSSNVTIGATSIFGNISNTNVFTANAAGLTIVPQLTSNAVTASVGTLNVGGAINYGPDYGLVGSFVSNIAGYNYVAVQNLSATGNASASFTAYNNTGTSYIDVGVNSSAFNAVASGFVNNALNTPNASYAYSYGGDMVVGTWNNNGLHFITNASQTVGDSMFISGNGNVYISGNLSVSGNTTQIYTTTNFLTETANLVQTSYLGGNSSINSGSITLQNNFIGTGAWQSAVINPTYGGTGVNNGSNTLTVSGSYTLNQSVASGAAPTFTGTNFTGIPNGGLTNSSVTVSAGTGLSGGGAVSLGGTITLTNAGVTALSSSGGGNLTVSASTGSITVALPATGPGATSVGSSTAIPVITTDAYGRVSTTSTAAVVAPAGTLTGSTLASGVTASSLTSVGTLTGLTVAGTTNTQTVQPSANVTYNLGSTTAWYNNIYGTSTHALYADLAENYQADKYYAPGTVLMFGGTAEVTVADADTTRVAGVVSTNPAHLMNGGLQGPNVSPLALTGRVPCMVVGPIAKGDLMVSAGWGYAKANNSAGVGQVIGKALQDFPVNSKGLIEVVVGRF